MKCPLLLAGAITHDEKIEDSAVECGKEECAWWRPSADMCRIAHYDECLFKLWQVLEEIKDKMPDELQFRK